MIDDFLTFSAEMTAFSIFELKGTGMARDYYEAITGVVGEATMAELLKVYAAIGDMQDREKKLRQMIFSNEKLGPVARNIIKLWYIGIWEALPHAWTEAYGAIENNVGFMVSAAAYTEGLLWTAIGANPPGAKAPGYGSWALPPRIPSF